MPLRSIFLDMYIFNKLKEDDTKGENVALKNWVKFVLESKRSDIKDV